MQKSYGKVDIHRKEQLLATVKATRPEKRDELDAIFSAELSPDELAFYHDITSGSASAPSVNGAASASHPQE